MLQELQEKTEKVFQNLTTQCLKMLNVAQSDGSDGGNYNNSMGGVDSSDQLIQTYAVLRKTRKWWKTLFLHFIDLSVVNSYIVNKEIEKIMLPKRPLETCLQDNYSNKVD